MSYHILLNLLLDWWKTALAWIGNPPQSPQTINARVSCQDQDKNHPSSRMRSSSPIHPTGRKVSPPQLIQEQTEEKLCAKVDNSDEVPRIPFRIGSVLEEVRLKNLKTLQLVQLPHGLPDTKLQFGNPAKSPKTITARVSCQDKEKNLPATRMKSSSPIQPSGRGVPLSSIHQEEHQEHHVQHKRWSTNLIGLVGWWIRVEK